MEEELKEKYELAIKFYDDKELEKAFNLFNELVEKYNDKNSKYYIAKIYSHFKYTKKDHENSYELSNKLIEKGEYAYEKECKNDKEENINDMPGTPITDKKREIKLLEYIDMELATKEEEAYYQKENNSYYARMDTDIEYNEKKYYKKFYISKDTIKEKREKGIWDLSGNYITPSELRDMRRSGMITVEEIEKGIFKEYDDGTTLIHWTTALADLYYDKEKKSMKINDYVYNTMLKRTFSFNPLTFYNSYITENEFYKDGTVDEFLIKILLDKKESNTLTDIIYTIQKNQNEIIRADATKSFIVQGCAGSGKTMILLHRLSYLKFNNKLPNYDKIKIITPNHLFASFIKSLTKDLSVQEIEQMTISDYYLLLNRLYLNRYNKMEQIDYKFYTRQKDKFERQFSVENMIDEHLILNNKIIAIYSSKLFNIIEQEYHKLMTAINDEIIKNGLDINEKYPDNKTYYEQVIKKIDIEIENLQKIIDDKKVIIQDIKNKIDDIYKEETKLEEKHNSISLEIQNIDKEYKALEDEKNTELNNKTRNSFISKQVIKDIGNGISDIDKIISQLAEEKDHISIEMQNAYKEYQELRKKKDTELTKKRMLFNKTRKSLMLGRYDAAIRAKMKEITTLKESQSEIEKKQEENIVKKEKINKNIDNLLSKRYNEAIQSKMKEIDVLKESKFEIERKQKENILKKNKETAKLEERQNDNNILNDTINKYNYVKNKILDNLYFTIDIYENIQPKIREKYNIQIDKKQYLKIDLLINLYINYIHIGRIINGDQLLCIDEAQDYSLIEYEILNIVNKNIVMNLYGDLNQSTYGEGIDNWEDLKEKLKCKMYILKENYRNSTQITEYCNEKFNHDILGMGLSIKNVEVIKKERIDEIINQKNKEGKSIAIISKENLKEKINNKFVLHFDVQAAKGTEYNTVIVNDKYMSKNEKYIAYTRALSELYILIDEE